MIDFTGEKCYTEGSDSYRIADTAVVRQHPADPEPYANKERMI